MFFTSAVPTRHGSKILTLATQRRSTQTLYFVGEQRLVSVFHAAFPTTPGTGDVQLFWIEQCR
jgi:hypothetical protein